MSKKPLTLSIIIPAYNEESHLRGCLDSVAKQTVKPDEVIVVDNNSTDKTADIAREYAFVTLVTEKKQGLIPARNAGFNAANGDLLGRIDADSILYSNWVAIAKHTFASSEWDAITGPGKIWVDAHFPRLLSTFWSRTYFLHAFSTFRFQVLWGPNMIIKRAVWGNVRREACLNDRLVHEDQDLSVLIRAHGYKIKMLKDLLIKSDGERLSHIDKALEYEKREKATIERHLKTGALQKARIGGISHLSARLLFMALLPFGLLYAVLTTIFLIERKLKLRR